MTNFNTTKKALLSSVVALLVCFTMLLGTTFAWFTDTATSAGNKIVTGNLDVELYKWTAADESGRVDISTDSAPVLSDDILWEPGYTAVVYLSIKNAGSLALKYRVALDVTEDNDNVNLTDVMSYSIAPDARYGSVTEWAGNGTYVVPGINATASEDVALLPTEEHFFALSIHMDEEAGNKYMNQNITFDIKVLAGQLASENDSFGPDSYYDKYAGYPGVGSAPVVDGSSATEIEVRNEAGYKTGSAVVPTDAVADDVNELKMYINDSVYNANISIGAGLTKSAYDVTVTGLKENNDVPVKVNIKIEPNLDPATVAVYHYDELIPSTYNPTTGYVTFESATFSPFTVVFNAESEYEAPEASSEYPTAKVTYESQYVNVDLPWESLGGFYPTEGLDSKLEAAFTFACPDYETATEEEKAIIDAYRYWYCDFFVSLDTALGADQLFLGGNYGDFGWIGFHNGDLTLDANTEIGLLSAVTTNPWTYNDIEAYVGEFICGVGDVNDALDGATFTVALRLIDPSKVDTSVSEWWADLPEGSYVDVNVVTYTFGGAYVID